ncbi:uncharacterized protein (DUF1800 family) [Rhodobium orientis]|uniref:DUF1800 domain-containing protein n=1 Tax=Rhodobium orientis TaxID=34017 RepID=A0A327JYN9_9HYPH|nr:DUF1800 domain-containing protein [Rhodobium orientis]MBB4301134.1 uncharacterized protein (DUF1800 family) [Rhodobium orientis]MBK5949798.1 hypothetical protein [Rhodobium orientis]RAI30092.1 hypothetical protein CH339_00745 [Rhodobium orientis]
MISKDAITALKRFGCGPRRGEAAGLASPREWLVAQLDRADAARIDDADLPRADQAQRDHVAYRRERKRQLRGLDKDNREQMDDLKRMMGPRPAVDYYSQEINARTRHAIETDAPLVERLVGFWSNHFCISAAKNGRVRAMAGAYEREAIRPYVLGRFRDMLFASAQHPAMLLYLDNEKSAGPNSPVGRRRSRGLNENLAREIMELHTLGVHGGYTQEDVTNFARILTGWSVGKVDSPRGGVFVFHRRVHEPGAFTVLGRRYGGRGVDQGEAVLEDLARHPATARFVAGKFARHFVGDGASDELVGRLAATFRETDGDLRELTYDLIASDEAWETPAQKLLPPYDFIVATARATGWRPQERQMMKALNALGHKMWAPPSPAGWPDEDDAWVSPDAMLERLDWAQRIARRKAPREPVDRIAEDLLGPALDDHSRQVIARAENKGQALALLLMTPGFQRR